MNELNQHYNEVKSFDIMVKYLELDFHSPENVFDSHVHQSCEIYINLSGDVSFIVENHIYPVKPGDVIITRPFEYHNCVYHSNKLHKHFWILFSSSGNERFLDCFFKRKPGENNHLVLSLDDAEELTSLCFKMLKDEKTETEKYCEFFKLISILQNSEVADKTNANYPKDIIYAINYINKNYGESISISELAKNSHVSINTLERHFVKYLNTTPSDYIRKKRFAVAANLLSQGVSVTEASEKSGFSDYSKFISLFKKYYGMTPLKYKKSLKMGLGQNTQTAVRQLSSSASAV